MKYNEKIAIIGAGPAGMAAALQLHRFGFEPLLFEQDDNGSLLLSAWKVENYLGISPGVSGIELLDMFKGHLKSSGIKPTMEKVLLLAFDKKHEIFHIKTNKNEYDANYAIVCSGTKSKAVFELQDIPLPLKKYVFCEINQLLKEHGKDIIIIGGGDAAFDFGMSLASCSNKIFIVNRSDKIKAIHSLQNIVLSNKDIIYKSNKILKNILPGKTKNISCSFQDGEETFNLEADYLVFAIGRTAQKDFYSSELAVNEKTLVENGFLYLAGDVKNDILRQSSIAVSDGVLAAMKIAHLRGL